MANMNSYTSRNRKIIDFCVGFFGIPAFYWISYLLLAFVAAGSSPLKDSLILAVYLALLLAIVGYGIERRFVVIGALYFFGVMSLIALGSC
jgi:hypothetical protein